jgi:phage regulator Rha-like protein
MKKRAIVLSRRVESRILVLRGHRVILDADLAELYGVEVKRLNQQVKRNIDRFPGDFVLQLSSAEYESLRLQIATSNEGRGGRRYLPYAFTEHGAIMAATVLNSKRAIEMSIFVVRAFVRMREALAANQQIVAKLTELECRLESHDADIQELVEAIRELMAPPAPNGRRIGFDYASSSAKLRGKAHGSWRHSVKPRTTSKSSSSKSTSAKSTSALIPSL